MCDRRFEGKEHAVAYLKYRVTPNELVPEVVDFLQRKAAGPLNLAVDVGCGSGQGTILLAPYFAKVVGTDISPAQLELAIANSNPPNVSYRQCPAEELPLAAGEVDLVTAFIAAHWFDRPRFLQEADRVLRPGGCLALLSYTMDFDLEYGNVSEQLNRICKEFYAALLPYRSATIGLHTRPLYKDMFDAWPYPDKEWHECVPVRKPMPLDAYVCMVETFSSYQALLKQDPAEATRLSAHTRDKLLCAMGTSSLDTEVVVVVKYFYWLSCKPSP